MTLRLAHQLRPRLDAAGLRELYDTMDGPLLPLLVRMEAGGIRVDVAASRGDVRGDGTALEHGPRRDPRLAGMRVQRRLAQADARGAVRAGWVSSRGRKTAKGKVRLHRRPDAGGTGRRARHRRQDPGVPRAGQAEGHLRGRPAAAGQPGDRPGAHLLPPHRGGDRPALLVQPEPAEHPGAHRGRAADPLGVRSGRGLSSSWPRTTRRSSCASWPTSAATRS